MRLNPEQMEQALQFYLYLNACRLHLGRILEGRNTIRELVDVRDERLHVNFA